MYLLVWTFGILIFPVATADIPDMAPLADVRRTEMGKAIAEMMHVGAYVPVSLSLYRLADGKWEQLGGDIVSPRGQPGGGYMQRFYLRLGSRRLEAGRYRIRIESRGWTPLFAIRNTMFAMVPFLP